MTDSDLNGSLPHGWVLTTIGEVAEVVGGGTPKTSVPGNFDDEAGHPWLTPADLTGHTQKTIASGRRFLTDQGLATSAAKYMPAGTILFSSRAPIGYVAIAENPVTTNQGFRSFVPSPALCPDYAYHYLRSISALANQMASGTTFNELSGSKAKTLPIPLPPLGNQQRIAERLDEIDERRASITTRLGASEHLVARLRNAVLASACSGRLTADWREANPEVTADQLAEDLTGGLPGRRTRRRVPDGGAGLTSEELIDLIPPSWRLVRLGDVLDVATGATPLRKNQAYYEDGTIPWVTSGAVNRGRIETPTELITPLALKETNVKLFPPGTLLVAMYGEGQTRGRVGELAIEAGTNQAVAALLFDDGSAMLRPFVRLFFEDGYRRIRALSVGGVQPNLNLGMIKETLLPLPPHEEQLEILRRARAAIDAAERMDAGISAAETALDSAMKGALAKAFRGELVPTEGDLPSAGP